MTAVVLQFCGGARALCASEMPARRRAAGGSVLLCPQQAGYAPYSVRVWGKACAARLCKCLSRLSARHYLARPNFARAQLCRSSLEG